MKRTVKLNESELRRMISESVRRVLNENNQYDLTPQELIDKYYKNFEEAYKLLDKANKLLNGSINVREIESINSKIDAGEVNNDIEYCLPEAVRSVSDARSYVGSVYSAMDNYNERDYKEPEDWYERNEHGDFDEY